MNCVQGKWTLTLTLIGTLASECNMMGDVKDLIHAVFLTSCVSFCFSMDFPEICYTELSKVMYIVRIFASCKNKQQQILSLCMAICR